MCNTYEKESYYVSAVCETYGSVENRNAIVDAAKNDTNFKQFCKEVLDRENVGVEDIFEVEVANEVMSGSTVLNRYDRLCIKYREYPLYLRWYVDEDTNRDYRIFYGNVKFSLGDFELVCWQDNKEKISFFNDENAEISEF